MPFPPLELYKKERAYGEGHRMARTCSRGCVVLVTGDIASTLKEVPVTLVAIAKATAVLSG